MAATKATKTRSTKSKKPPEYGLAVAPRVSQDFGNYYQTELTPERAKRILRAAAYGEPFEQNILFDEMLETDTDLDNAYRTRLLGLTNLEWELVSALQVGRAPTNLTPADERLAQEVLDYCLEVITGIDGFTEMLCHCADSIGRSVAVGQFIWDTVEGQRRPIAAEAVLGTQLRIEAMEPTRLRIATDENQAGVAIDEFPAGQFLVRQPRSIGGSFFRGGLHRGSVVGHMIKRMARKSWWFGVEMFGLPISVAKYDTITEEDKTKILSMLKDLSIARGGLFPKGCEFEFVEFSQQGQWPQERLLQYIDAGYAKHYLGQTLTTQIGEAGGAQAAATIHNEVREDIRDDDRAAEARDVREQILRPLVLYKFGEAALRFIPHHRRIIEEPQDDAADMTTLKDAVNDLGFPVPMRHVVDRFGLPVVEGTDLDAPLPGRKSAPNPFDMPPELAAATARRREIQLHAASLLDRITQRGSAVARLVPWIVAAVLASQAHTEEVFGRFSAALAPFDDATAMSSDITVALGGAFERLPTDDLQELARQSLLAAELFGRDLAIEQARRGRRRASASLNAARIDFEKVPFVEAIESFRDRIGMDPETFIKLDAEARSRAWRVAGVWDMDLLAVLHTNLVQSFANGETVRDFRQRVLPLMGDAEGWTGETPWHADVVFLQNFKMATTAGSYRQFVDLDIRYYRIVGNGDSCPICAPEIGRIYPVSNPKRMDPFHFGCDCDHEPVFDDEVSPEEVSDPDAAPNEALAAERARENGFKFDVRQYAGIDPIPLAKYPTDYHAAFRRMAEARGLEVAA